MPYLIYDRYGNPYTNLSPTNATLYHNKYDALKQLRELPTGYTVRAAATKKEVKD